MKNFALFRKVLMYLAICESPFGVIGCLDGFATPFGVFGCLDIKLFIIGGKGLTGQWLSCGTAHVHREDESISVYGTGRYSPSYCSVYVSAD